MQATGQKHRGLLGSVNCLDLELGADLRPPSETERAVGACFGRAYLGKRGIGVGFGHELDLDTRLWILTSLGTCPLAVIATVRSLLWVLIECSSRWCPNRGTL